jgi:hypothetical protein
MVHGLIYREFFEVLVTLNTSFMSYKYCKGKLHVHTNSKKNISSSLPLKITRQVSSKRLEAHFQRCISHLRRFESSGFFVCLTNLSKKLTCIGY